MNTAQYDQAIKEVDGITVKGSDLVQPNHFWIGQEDQEFTMQMILL